MRMADEVLHAQSEFPGTLSKKDLLIFLWLNKHMYELLLQQLIGGNEVPNGYQWKNKTT